MKCTCGTQIVGGLCSDWCDLVRKDVLPNNEKALAVGQKKFITVEYLRNKYPIGFDCQWQVKIDPEGNKNWFSPIANVWTEGHGKRYWTFE